MSLDIKKDYKMECPLTITDEAVVHLKSFLAQSPEAKFVRVGVKGAGCSGFTWILDLAQDKTDRDFTFEISGLSIIIDAISVNYLKSTQISWKESLMGSGFAFSAPQARTCGCGSSFSVD